MGIYLKTPSGATGLTPHGFSEVYEKTSSGAVLLYQSALPHLLLYGNGDMQTAVTGGWAKGYTNYLTSVSVTNSASGLVYRSSGSDDGDDFTSISTANTIDVTEYSTLEFTFSNTGNKAIATNMMFLGGRTQKTQSITYSKPNFSFYSRLSNSLAVGQSVTVTVDVSGTSGSYYISMSLYSTNTVTLTECKLIK